MLFMLGTVIIDVYPFNVDKVRGENAADFARKEIVGAMTPREFMGEGDNYLTLSGTLYPHFFARNSLAYIGNALGGAAALTPSQGVTGLDQWQSLQASRASGTPQLLMRGDGLNMGWWLIEKMVESHDKLDVNGVGRIIQHEIHLVKSPSAATAGALLNNLISLFSGL